MNDVACFIVTLLEETNMILVNVGISIPRSYLPRAVELNPLDPANREVLRRLLPTDIDDIGEIVDVMPVFAIVGARELQ